MNAIEWAEAKWRLPDGSGIVLRPWQRAVLRAMFPADASPSPWETFLISTVKKADAVVRAEQEVGDELAPTLALMCRAAAMTGLRQGELIALSWRDVDWAAGKVRVRRSYVRGEFSSPKSRRGSRSVPLAFPYAFAVPCTASDDADTGSECSVSTTADAVRSPIVPWAPTD